MRMGLSLLILSPLIVSQAPVCPPLMAQAPACPTQTYLPLTGYSVPVDPNRIAFDYQGTDPMRPSAPQRLLICPPIVIALGQTAKHTGWVCDPNNDAMQLTATQGTLNIRPDGTYEWSLKPTAVGPLYVNLTVVDIRTTGDAKSTTGTLMVFTRAANRPPVIGCGARP